jgi:hypothetical protein
MAVVRYTYISLISIPHACLSLSLYGGTWMERMTARVVVEATVGLGFEIDRMRISNVLRP